MMVTKFYCYVDETGQDTGGELFLVAVVLKDIEGLERLEHKLEDLEIRSGKKQLKWGKTHFTVRQEYLLQIAQIKKPGCLDLATQHC